jgi:O-antigen/teichoic acid export membrane protein
MGQWLLRNPYSAFRRNMIVSAMVSVLNIPLVLISYRIYLRALGWETFGTWTLLSSCIMLAQLGAVGMNSAISKLTAESVAKGNEEDLNRYVGTALFFAGSTGGVGVGTAFVFREWVSSALHLGNGVGATVAALLPWTAALSVYVLMVELLSSALEGCGRIDRVRIFQLAGQCAGIGVSLLLLKAGGGVVALLSGTALSYVLIHAGVQANLSRMFRARFFTISNVSLKHGRELLRLGGWVFAGSVISLLLVPLNRILLARYHSVAATSVLDVAWSGAMRIRSVVEVSLRSLLPEISKSAALWPRNWAGEVRGLVGRGVKVVVIVGLPLHAGIFAATTQLLNLWLGSTNHPDLGPTFRILLAGTFLSLLGVPAYYALVALGQAQATFAGLAAQAVVNAALVWLYSSQGRSLTTMVAAGAMSAGMAASTALTARLLYLYLRPPAANLALSNQSGIASNSQQMEFSGSAMTRRECAADHRK